MKKLKRFILITLTAASVALLIGCSNDSQKTMEEMEAMPVDLGEVEGY